MPAAMPQLPPEPQPETRLPRQRRVATPAAPPSLPPHCSSCLRLCWNVTGVGARACPDSRTHALARKASLSPQVYLCGWWREDCLCPEGHLRLLPLLVPVVAAAPVLQPRLLQVGEGLGTPMTLDGASRVAQSSHLCVEEKPVTEVP